jgi:hypothetical protein
VVECPRSVRCDVTGTGQERQSRCAEWAARSNDARLVVALNGSQELAQLARGARQRERV